MNKLQKQVEKLGSEKGALQRERSDLQRQCSELAGAVDKLNKDKVLLETQMEMEVRHAISLTSISPQLHQDLHKHVVLTSISMC